MNNSHLKSKLAKAQKIELSLAEKGSLRVRFMQYMNANPLAHKSPFYTFTRAVSMATFVGILVLGTGSIVTFASQSSLPGELLYPVKIASEKVKHAAIKTPEAKIDYSLALVEKRYNETNTLIAEHSLNQGKESVITKNIQSTIADIQQENDKIAKSNPAIALSNNSKLAQTLKTNTQVLLAVSEKNQNSTLSAKNTTAKVNNAHAKLVLAAYESAAKITLKTEQLQEIVLSDTDIVTVKTAEKKYADILPKLEIALAAEQSTTSSETTETPVETKTTTVLKVEKPTVETKAEIPVVSEVKTKQPEPETLTTLSEKLHTAYEAKEFNQVIIIADQIDQKLSDAAKIKTAEKKYDIIVPPQTDVQPVIEKTIEITTEKK
jgi:hypothetical protein